MGRGDFGMWIGGGQGKRGREATQNVEPVFVPARRDYAVASAECRTENPASSTSHPGITDWRKIVARADIDVIDIATPPNVHCEIAVAAAEAGKHVFCEKPIALSAAEAGRMCQAAERNGIVNYLNHEYRRCPAIALARQLIDEGRIGRIFHWRGAYLQSWLVDPDFPLTWHLRKETAGSGAQSGINSHSVDLARYLVGEIKSVVAMKTTFVKERPLAGEAAGTFNAAGGEGRERLRPAYGG
ncbi:MAG: Gfo/Idh/MocA family oxidoreductase [Phycisphaerae bacterium]